MVAMSKRHLIMFVGVFLSAVAVFISKAEAAQGQNLCQPQSTVSINVPGLKLLGGQIYNRLDQSFNGYTNPSYTPTGKTGGLYPGGGSVYPNLNQAEAIAEAITPLNTDGEPDPQGKIVFVSIGMSNTSMEFMALINKVQDDPSKNPALAMVNGARSGQDATQWLDDSTHHNWSHVLDVLNAKGLSAKQVQVAWVKEAHRNTGNFPDEAESLQQNLKIIVRNLKIYFPNIKIAYLSSRARSYQIYNSEKPGEPAAFETGFSVKWLIEEQLAGANDLRFTGASPVAPLLLWGPYFWSDTWPANYLRDDCIHPSPPGLEVLSDQFVEFLKEDLTARAWFLNDGNPTPSPSSVPSPSPNQSSPSPSPWPTPTPSLLPSSSPNQSSPDMNHDGNVDMADYELFIQYFGATNDCASEADFDQNCMVDIFDYNILVAQFGAGN